MELQATYRENKVSELIETTQNENGEIVVSGRELHKFLEVSERYNSWLSRMLGYGFEEGIDFTSVKSFTVVNNGAERELDNHALKIDMAKEIAMIQRSEKGKQARQYFLQLEKMWNSPEMVMKRALEFANKQVEDLKQRTFSLETKVQEQQPKVLFAEAVTASDDCILIGDLAKLLNNNGIKIGRNKLFQWLRENGYLQKLKNIPTQRAVDLGLFKLHESVYFKSDKSTGLSLTAKVTAKGQEYFVSKFLKFNLI